MTLPCFSHKQIVLVQLRLSGNTAAQKAQCSPASIFSILG